MTLQKRHRALVVISSKLQLPGNNLEKKSSLRNKEQWKAKAYISSSRGKHASTCSHVQRKCSKYVKLINANEVRPAWNGYKALVINAFSWPGNMRLKCARFRKISPLPSMQ